MSTLIYCLLSFLFGLYCGNKSFRGGFNRIVIGLVNMVTGKKSKPIQQKAPPHQNTWIRPDAGRPEPPPQKEPKVDITDKYERREYLAKEVSDEELIDLLVKRGRLTKN